MSIENPATCGGDLQEGDIDVVPLPQAVILPETTFAELKVMPVSDVIKALCPNPIVAETRQQGPIAGVFYRYMNFPGIGSIVGGHAHNFGHGTLLYKGSINARSWAIDPATGQKIGDPVERQFIAPCVISIDKDRAHEFIALEEDTGAVCTFALRDFDGQVIENWNGNMNGVS